MKENNLKTMLNIYEDSNINSYWDSKKEKYYYNIIDIIRTLTEESNIKEYWNTLKERLKKENSPLLDNIVKIKTIDSNGKYHDTEMLDTKNSLRLIMEINTSKAENMKNWLAHIGNKKLTAEYNPELEIRKIIDYYHEKGNSNCWVLGRVEGILEKYYSDYKI